MAKRVRGSRSAHRPGGQGPSRAKKTSNSAAPVPAPDDVAPASSDELVTDADYGEVEVDEVSVDEVAVAALVAATPAEEEPEPTRSPRRTRRKARKQRPDDLAARAAAEDVWVREDLRRIGGISVVLLVALAVAWIVFGYLDVLNLY